MTRKSKSNAPKKESVFRKIFYYSFVLLITFAAVRFYLYWLDSYRYSHPTVFQTEAGVYTEELPFEGVLLWNERVIIAPTTGKISLSTAEPRRVRKNEILCSIAGIAVRAPTAGYFIPAVDGLEEDWSYARIWTGTSSLPNVPEVTPVPNGSYIDSKQVIGKIIPHPQELRAVAWIDLTPSLKQDIDRRRVRVKRKDGEWGAWAEIRTTEVVSQRVKMYVSLPFFTPDMLKRRSFAWRIVVGDRHGLYVPNSAVIFRGGVMGVYVVRGNEATFRQVEAFHADEENFFITSGVTPGDLVILNAESAREGQVNIW